MRALTVLGLLIIACGGAGESPPAAPPEQAAPERAANAAYTIHEWGFVAHHYAAVPDQLLTSGTAPTPVSATNIGLGNLGHIGHGGKPVLYVHLGDGGDLARFTATLSTSGTFVEEWPHSANSTPTSLTWEVEARRGSCTAAASYPVASDNHCAGIVDGYCEAAELAHYETGDSACLTIDGSRWNHLFYRARTTGDLPLRVSKNGEVFTVQIAAPIPGRLMRIRRGDNAADTRVVSFDAPATGESLSLPTPESAAAVGVAALETELRALGMSDDEVRAFMTAWQAELFGVTPDRARVPMAGLPPFALRPKFDALVYFLPAATLDAMVPLTFSPPPAEVHRAVLVRVDLESPSVEARAADTRPIRATLGEVEVRGRLPIEVARRVVRRYRTSLLTCYEQHIDSDETSNTLQLVVGTDGSVESATIGPGPDAFRSCVTDSARRWVFPVPEAGTLRVTIPFQMNRR